MRLIKEELNPRDYKLKKNVNISITKGKTKQKKNMRARCVDKFEKVVHMDGYNEAIICPIVELRKNLQLNLLSLGKRQ